LAHWLARQCFGAPALRRFGRTRGVALAPGWLRQNGAERRKTISPFPERAFQLALEGRKLGKRFRAIF